MARVPDATTPPQFSVITITFNAGALFDRTRDSLLRQTCQDFEWLVIDGLSTDDTVARIQATPRVDQWLSERDQGIPDAWNKGLARASGRSVLILNAGDTFHPRFLEQVAARVDDRRIVCAPARVLSESGRLVGIARAQPRKLGHAMHVPHNWCAVPLKHYRALGGYEALPLAADFAWFHRYWRMHGADGFVVLAEPGGDFYLGGRSDTRFAQTFREQEDVVVAQGGNRLKARFVRWFYTSRHRLKGWMLRSRGVT